MYPELISLSAEHDHIGRRVADGREWDSHVRVAIEQVSRSGSVAIDVGAYIGIHTITMSRCFNSVYAFEPQRGVYHLLCGNLALNGCTNVIARKLAFSDQPGSMRLAPAEWQEVAVPLVDGQPDYDHISNAAALASRRSTASLRKFERLPSTRCVSMRWQSSRWMRRVLTCGSFQGANRPSGAAAQPFSSNGSEIWVPGMGLRWRSFTAFSPLWVMM